MTLEDRIRAGLGAEADLLDRMPEFRLPPVTGPRRARSPRRWLVPVTVAAAVALTVALVTLATGRTAGTGPDTSPAYFTIGDVLRPAGKPRFVITVPLPYQNAPSLPGGNRVTPYKVLPPVVLDAATHKVVSTIPLPRGWWAAVGVWYSPDNRTFVLASRTAEPDSTRPLGVSPVRLFRIRLDGQGRPVGDSVPVPGDAIPQVDKLATSPDGRRVAFSEQHDQSSITVIDTVTGLRRSWRGPSDGRVDAITWTPDGRDVAVAYRRLRSSGSNLLTFDINRPGYDLLSAARSTRIPISGELIEDLAIAPDGGTLILAAHSLTPGASQEEFRRLRLPLTDVPSRPVVGLLSEGLHDLRVDGTACYLVRYDKGLRIERFDLATGDISTFFVDPRQGMSDGLAIAW